LSSTDTRPSGFRPRQLTNCTEEQRSGSSFKKASFMRKFTNRLARSVSIQNGGVEPVCPESKLESAHVESQFGLDSLAVYPYFPVFCLVKLMLGVKNVKVSVLLSTTFVCSNPLFRPLIQP
jgi:hypothetical protein